MAEKVVKMFKPILFLTFVALIQAVAVLENDLIQTISELLENPGRSVTCEIEAHRFSTCLKNVFEKIRNKRDASAVPSKAEVFAKVAAIRSSLQCVGEPKCNRLKVAKYMLDSLVYSLEHAFGRGYECIDEKRNQQDLIHCTISSLLSEKSVEDIQNEMENNLNDILERLGKPIAKCVSTKSQCAAHAKNEFYKGSVAFADLYSLFLQVQRSLQSWEPILVDTFDKKFNPNVYNELIL